MIFTIRVFLCACLVILISGCIDPSDARPGLYLSGEVEPFPEDWAFTRDFREISIEVETPYFLSHSVTIWCAEGRGTLFVGARNPESKNWPSWVDANPKVTLKIGDKLFNARLEPVDDSQSIDFILTRYAEKYNLPESDERPDIRYWRVLARS